jgi:hypothetical protein
MGAKADSSGGQVRLIVAATAAAAALYGTVVLLGLGPSSPFALSAENVRSPLPVHVRLHDHAVPRPAARVPQPSRLAAQQHVRVARTPPVQPSSSRSRRGTRAAVASKRAQTTAPSVTRTSPSPADVTATHAEPAAAQPPAAPPTPPAPQAPPTPQEQPAPPSTPELATLTIALAPPPPITVLPLPTIAVRADTRPTLPALTP